MKLPKKINFGQVLILISLIGLTLSLWGLWDIGLWISLYPGTLFPLPFNVIRIPWYIAGDLFVALIATFETILGVIALEGARAKSEEAAEERALIVENIKAFKELVIQLKKHRTTQKKDKS
jgi:hypothetical protein